LKIGVLALQGDYYKHNQILESIGIEPVNIRYPYELDNIEGLVIPGGESTTMTKLMIRMGFYKPLKSFANNYPVLGTCAGLILMSKKVVDTEIEPLGMLDIKVERNGFGRQINSNTINIDVEFNNINFSLPASFIRAPKIVSYGDSITVLAMRDGEPIIVKNDKHLGISFHPELDNISILHEYVFMGGKTNQ